MPETPVVIDLTRGTYRRLYSGYLNGKKINEVSSDAETWFWRIHSVVDDFGNHRAEPSLLCAATKGRREYLNPKRKKGKITPKLVEALTNELYDCGLLAFYWDGDEKYLHIKNFETWQPAANRNGKRTQRFPRPEDVGCSQVQPGATRGDHVDHNKDQDQDHNHNQEQPPFGGTDFLAAFELYEKHRAHKRSKLTEEARHRLFLKFKSWGEERSTAAILYSIEQGWLGVFEQKGVSPNAASVERSARVDDQFNFLRARDRRTTS